MDDIVYKLVYIDMEKTKDEQILDIQTAEMEENELFQMFENPPGIFDLLYTNEEISSLNIITNKGLKLPNVFENFKFEHDEEFYLDTEDGQDWKAILYVGTDQGNCFTVQFYIDDQEKIQKRVVKVLDNGGPMNLLKKKESNVDLNERKMSDPSSEYLLNSNEDKVKELLRPQVHDFKRFSHENVQIAVIGEQMERRVNLSRKLKIFLRSDLKEQWTSVEVDTRHRHNFSESNFFKVFSMRNDNWKNYSRFYLTSTLGICILRFHQKDNTLHVLRYIKKYIPGRDMICYSSRQRLFYIPTKSTMEIWNEELNFSTYNINFDSKIRRAYVVENDSVERLLVYDNNFYYEIDLVSLHFRRKDMILKEGNSRKSVMPFNINLFPHNRLFRIPFFKEKVNSISFIDNVEALNLMEFPFKTLIHCFDKQSYYYPIKEYAMYYFNKLKQINYEDTVYGPVSPLFFAIYHNDMRLLEDLLENYRYPQKTVDYVSPLLFALKYKYNSAVKVFCDYLVRRNYPISFTRLEFVYLLKSPFSYCHKLMATIPSEPTLQNFPRMVCMNRQVQLHFVKEVGHLLFSLKRKEFEEMEKKIKKRKKQKKKLVSFTRSFLRRAASGVHENTLTKSEVISFQIPFKYSYSVGTPDSVNFLDSFSQSNTEEFTLSQWKEVVVHKWSRHRIIHIILAVLYWIFTLITTLSLVFFPKITILKYISLGFILFFVCFETLQVISYIAFNIRR